MVRIIRSQLEQNGATHSTRKTAGHSSFIYTGDDLQQNASTRASYRENASDGVNKKQERSGEIHRDR